MSYQFQFGEYFDDLNPEKHADLFAKLDSEENKLYLGRKNRDFVHRTFVRDRGKLHLSKHQVVFLNDIIDEARVWQHLYSIGEFKAPEETHGVRNPFENCGLDDSFLECIIYDLIGETKIGLVPFCRVMMAAKLAAEHDEERLKAYLHSTLLSRRNIRCAGTAYYQKPDKYIDKLLQIFKQLSTIVIDEYPHLRDRLANMACKCKLR